MRIFPGNNGQFTRFLAKVDFFLTEHVTCHSPCRTIALAIGGLSPAHGCAPRLLLLQAQANISRKQWAFHKFPGKSRLFLALHVGGHSSCRTTVLAHGGLRHAHALAPRLLLAPARANISRKQWAFHKFPGKSRHPSRCTRRQSLSLPDDCTASRQPAACTCLCTPPIPASSTCEYLQETMCNSQVSWQKSPFSLLHTSPVTLPAGRLQWRSEACRLHMAAHPVSSSFKLKR